MFFKNLYVFFVCSFFLCFLYVFFNSHILFQFVFTKYNATELIYIDTTLLYCTYIEFQITFC